MFEPRNIWIAIATLVAAYLAYTTLQATQPGPGEAVAFLRTMRGGGMDVTRITEADCEAMERHVWAVAGDDVACIAYVSAGEQAVGELALVYFHGDFPTADQTAAKMAMSVRGYQRRARSMAQRLGIPVFMIARPGVMGSTGFHVIGGIGKEEQLIASAIDRLKRRHRIARLVLGGQSGGARLAAQLLASGRRDIRCAVMASGAYGIPGAKRGGRMPTNIWGEPSKSYFIPLRNVQSVVHDGGRRLLVVGDPRDKRTAFAEQREWAQALQRAGHHAVLLEAPGGGDEFHYLGRVAMEIAGKCASGESDAAIAAYVGDLRGRAGSGSPN